VQRQRFTSFALAAATAVVVSSLAYPAQTREDEGRTKAALFAADFQYRLGSFVEAEESYRQVLAASPDSQDALVGVGKCLVALGRFREAVPVLMEAVNRKPGDREAMRHLAHAVVELNQFVPAEDLLKTLQDGDPNDKEVWYYLGVLMYQNGYYGSALQDLEKSSDPASGDPARKLRTAIDRAVSLEKLGRTQEAEASITGLLSNPTAREDPDLLLTLAELLYDTNRLEGALQRSDEAVKARPDLAMGYFWRAKVLFRLGRVAQAAEAAEQAVRLSPRLPFPRSLLVKIYQAEGRTEEAVEQADWLREYQDRISGTQSR
jgi:tetratricopeptide (TPR) repeat protein